MSNFFIAIIAITLIYLFFSESPASVPTAQQKQVAAKYLNEFEMYICISKRTVFYPPKTLKIGKDFRTLNLYAKNNIFIHKNLSQRSTTNGEFFCRECYKRCPLSSPDIADMKLNFKQYSQMNNHQLCEHLKNVLPEETYKKLVGSI